MKKIVIVLILIFFSVRLYSQKTEETAPNTKEVLDNALTANTLKDYKGDFVFGFNTMIYESDGIGNKIKDKPSVMAKKSFTFTVEHVDIKTGNVTIKFWHFNLQSDSEKYNNKYFFLSADDFKSMCEAYKFQPKLTYAVGTFTTPFKFRPTKSVFANNLSLGASISALTTANKRGWSYGGVLGFSLTQISLDSASTNNKVKTSTDRPAYTPSLHFIAAHGNINLTFGFGMDYINRPSPIEQSWIFNGKPWIGFGIGVSLFNPNTTAKTTEPSSDQTKTKKGT